MQNDLLQCKLYVAALIIYRIKLDYTEGWDIIRSESSSREMKRIRET